MSTWGPSDKPEVVMSGQLDNTREINVWFSNGGHHSAERPWEARRGGSFRVAASVGLRPQDGVRSNRGLTLQSFQLRPCRGSPICHGAAADEGGEDEGLKAESSAGGAVWLRRLGVVSTLKRNKQTTERRSLKNDGFNMMNLTAAFYKQGDIYMQPRAPNPRP